MSDTSPFELTDRCAVVTGASSGIGQAIANAPGTAGEEVPDAPVFLAADAPRVVTGRELLVDGGLVINGAVGDARG